MTICIAAKTRTPSGEVVTMVGSDTEFVVGNDYRALDLENDSKIFKINDALIAYSGHGAVGEVLKELQREKSYLDITKFQTEEDLTLFAKAFFSQYKLFMEQGIATVDETNVGALLVATPENIYSVL